MKDGLRPGLRGTLRYVVPDIKTVPHLYPESEEFTAMPEVFATGFLVGLVEWACIQIVNPFLDWPAEQTVGVHVDISHSAPTPPGREVTAEVEVTAVEGRRLDFSVAAHDGIDQISAGTHRRHVIDRARFDQTVDNKLPDR